MEIKYEAASGIAPVTNPDTLAVIERVIEKVCRVEVSDGRTFIGLLMSCDQQRCLFLQDALEVVDRAAADYFDHDMFT